MSFGNIPKITKTEDTLEFNFIPGFSLEWLLQFRFSSTGHVCFFVSVAPLTLSLSKEVKHFFM